MAKPLNEQVVVITGASSGIGRETALRLAREGASVVVSARSDEVLDDLVQEIKSAGGEATSIAADVSEWDQVTALVKGAKETYGRIDTWVNNAGVLLVGEFEKTDLDEARRVFNVNFWGELHGMKAVLPVMREQGYGTIINITSVTAKRPLPLMSVYSASKSAINGLSEAIRTEIQDTHIDLCTIMPATIDTPLYEHARSKEGQTPKAAPPIYPPSEVANAIAECARNPRREMFAGKAGALMAFGNTLMPGVLDKLLGAIGRPALLKEEPQPARGHDNLDRPMDDETYTSTGGQRGRRTQLIQFAPQALLGLAALFALRRLAKR